MDCMPLRPGPFHYLISEQAKSLVALQELQNEVGALLEFRDLVIETFPNLRHKMAATASAGASVMSSTCTQSSHIPLPLSSPSSRRISEWEPGKIRRRVTRESSSGGGSGGSGSGGGGESSSSLPRSRSNSHSGGTKNNCSATVQDSGFSTETSSKDSASTAIAPRVSSPRPNTLDEAEDELWNLLDVIHRKGIRLREEVECLQGRLESVATEELVSTDVLEAVRKITGLGDTDRTIGCNGNVDDGSVDPQQQNSRDPQVIALRREKEQLLDKVAELEAETISSRARAQELQTELAALSALKTGLEDRLRAGLTENASEILTPGVQRLQPIAPVISSPKNANVTSIKSNSSAFVSVTGSPGSKAHKSRFRTRTIEKNVLLDVVGCNDEMRNVDIDVEANVNERRARLGALDSILVSPTRVTHVKDVDSRKIAAILREHSPLELQRHLITTTVHNQVLQKRLDEVKKSTETLSERLDKAREENDDLRFQLEERNIELEGTRARVRVLERLQQRPPTEAEPEADLEHPRCEQSGLEPGSSTESARDHHQPVEIKPSPRRRPSRIPLPGNMSGKTTTTPTTSVTATTPARPPSHGRNDSRESLKSLTRPPRDSSRDSHGGGKSLSKPRESSRDSLGNRSLSRSGGNGSNSSSVGGGSKETNRESSLNNRSLPRNNSSRDSLNKSSSLSRARDSLESNNNLGTSSPNTGTVNAPPRRPPAPARRSHSLARAATSVDASENGKVRPVKQFFWSSWLKSPLSNGPNCTEPPSSWCSTNSSFRHSDSSLYPDSLNQETSSVTGSTRVEFIIGSPTRRFRPSSAWPHRYFDSIDSAATVPESLLTDEFPLRRGGEALAEDFAVFMHLLKCAIGTGILFLPHAFRRTGYAMSIVCGIVTGTLCIHTAVIIVQCSQVLCRRNRVPMLDFAETAQFSFQSGPERIRKYARLFGVVTNVIICFVHFQGAVIYILYVATSFQQVMEFFTNVQINSRVYIVIFFPFTCALGFVPNLKYLTPFSIIGTSFLFLGVCTAFYYFLDDVPDPRKLDVLTEVLPVPMYCAIFLFALHNMTLYLPLENTMRHPSHMPRLIIVSTLLNVVIYLTFGFLGYNKYPDACDTVIKNLPMEETLAQVVKIAISLSVLFTFGLTYYVPISVLWPMIHSRIVTKSSLQHRFYESLLRLGGVIGTTLLAIAVPQMIPLLGLFSALGLSTLMLLIPILIETSTKWAEATRTMFAKNIVIFIVWLIILVFGTIESTWLIIREYSGTKQEEC
ncbi:PREDICTED: uncharacterized protein LOC108760307 [Trachymyrmex cornetzi]|uniref:uncharacterized protein LOC108760307 n=1 Tax=Trachymyrmex cornetzi TaxID=471704 RepID=UPI00084F0933|nr:PREDICTED: uncharacterized protein LOC108760307 [Trachymyrmex cornetzi]